MFNFQAKNANSKVLSIVRYAHFHQGAHLLVYITILNDQDAH